LTSQRTDLRQLEVVRVLVLTGGLVRVHVLVLVIQLMQVLVGVGGCRRRGVGRRRRRLGGGGGGGARLAQHVHGRVGGGVRVIDEGLRPCSHVFRFEVVKGLNQLR
jgi:hypothetical protein